MVDMGVEIAIFDGDSILLTMREDFEVWCLPGGAVDPNESLADAARREAREETGLEVELMRLVAMYSRLGWHDHHVALFAARIAGGTLTPDPREVVEARFFSRTALPEPMLVGHDRRAADAFSGASGIVRTELFSVADAPDVNRAQLYALRDQSGLSRRDFYLNSIALLQRYDSLIELPGFPNQ